MVVVVRTEPNQVRRAFSFTASALVHASVLAWIALAPLWPEERPATPYDQMIRPNEAKLVWYDLREKLPDITPPKHDTRPPRARARAEQTLVAGPRDDNRPPQLIWTPAPEIEAREALPAPNVVALTPPAPPVREFTAPVERPRLVAPVPALPDAPKIAAASAKPVALPPPDRPQPRAFTPPAETKAAAAKPILAAAPELTIALDRTPVPTTLLPPMQAARKTFIPPVEAAHAPAPQVAALPVAPAIDAHAPAAAPVLAGMPMARAVRAFTAPTTGTPMQTASPQQDLPAAPRLEIQEAAATPNLPATPMARPLRAFAAPAAKVIAKGAPAAVSLADAPAVPAMNRTTEAAFAIVGLNPTRQTDIPAPKASQSAGFSAGPTPRPDGGDSSADGGQLTVPGLFVRGGAHDERPTLVAVLEPPTSRRNLAASSRPVAITKDTEPAVAQAARATAPDPRLSGRVVYTVAIQMPNITSYSGSWIVWFAEREPVPGEALPTMQAPHPLRKVDPKYIPAAVDEKVEGKVRLAAVIRRDGHVERVELLQHLDNRLDQSSQEALAKWEFEPAVRNGVPIDVDAVFEIPFHVAPKVPK